MKTVIVNPNDAQQRLDKFLSKLMKGAPLGLIYKYIRKKRVKVNGRRCEIGYPLKEGDRIDLYVSDDLFAPGPAAVNPEFARNLSVLYEDEHILLADKKPGVSVHAGSRKENGTLVEQVQAYLMKTGEYDPGQEHTFAPALCNRIDRNTGGIVIAAKNAAALRAMNEAIRENRVTKEYLCIALGTFERKKGEIEGYLKKNEKENRVVCFGEMREGAKYAKTLYEVLGEKNGLSLVRVRLVTGRTHQIRAQMAFIGHPLLGDGKYGGKERMRPYRMRYQALYADRLTFSFPEADHFLHFLDGQTFEAGPVDFVRAWEEGTLWKTK